MDVRVLSSEFLGVLKKCRRAVNQEIETLEHSSEDINVLVKAVDETDSLLGREGLSLIVEELKDLLETVTTDENYPAAIGNGKEIVQTDNANESKEGPMDVEMKKVTRENIEIRGPEYMLKRKKAWVFQHAKLLSNILTPVLPLITVDRNLDLMFYLNDFMACDDTNILSDGLHVRRCYNADCKEYTFKCFYYDKAFDETCVDLHTDIVKRIHKRMLKFIELYADPLHKPRFSKTKWLCFSIRVNSVGESLLHIKGRFSDVNLSTVIDKLKEEFNSDEAKDCNLHSLVITNLNDKSSSHVVFGTQHIFERIWNMSFVIDSTYSTSWDPVAMRNLSECLYNLAKPNKTQTGMVLFNLLVLSPVPVLYMADSCRNVVNIQERTKAQEFVAFEAGRNNIQNITYSQFISWPALFKEYFNKCSEVCLVIGSFNRVKWDEIPWIINEKKISKIIFLNTFENMAGMWKLANFFELNDVEDPFILTQVVHIDLSPFREDVQMLLLLERLSNLSGKIIPNKKFSADVFNNLKGTSQELSLQTLGITIKTIEKQSPEVILKNLSHQLQAIEKISNIKSLTQQPQVTGKTSNKRVSGKPQKKIDGSNISKLKKLQKKDVHEITHTLQSRKTLLQAANNSANVPPSNSNIPPLEKVHHKITYKTSNMPSFKSKIFRMPHCRNPNVRRVGKRVMSARTRKRTSRNFKVDIRSANKIESYNEEMKFITSYEVSDEDKVYLDDLNVSQKRIMSLIIKETDDCDKLDLDKEYHTAISLKKGLVNFEAKRLSDTLIPLLPQLFMESSLGLAFQQLDMIPCPSERTLSEKHFIMLEKNSTTDRILNSLNANDAVIPLQHSMSYKAKNICKFVANFIFKSGYPMFNEQGRGLWGMFIRVNSNGDPWLLVEGKVDTDQEASLIISDLVPKLKSFFLTGLSAKKVQDLHDIILRIFTNINAETRAVFGDTMFLEKAGPFLIKFHGTRYQYYNPYGMMGLANEILKLADVDERWGVVQVGYGCGIESLRLAKESAMFYLLRHPAPLDIYFFTKVNCIGMGKFVYHPVSHAQAMESVIVNDMAQYFNVCVLYDLSETIGFFGASVLRDNYNVRRIIYVINPNNKDWIKEAVSCCQNTPDCTEPFVITKFVSVDMAPYDGNVRMICLLERESCVKRELRINDAFSEKAVEKFLSS